MIVFVGSTAMHRIAYALFNCNLNRTHMQAKRFSHKTSFYYNFVLVLVCFAWKFLFSLDHSSFVLFLCIKACILYIIASMKFNCFACAWHFKYIFLCVSFVVANWFWLDVLIIENQLYLHLGGNCIFILLKLHLHLVKNEKNLKKSCLWIVFTEHIKS